MMIFINVFFNLKSVFEKINKYLKELKNAFKFWKIIYNIKK